MKKVFIKLMTIALLVGIGFLSVGNFVQAQNYQIHEKIPGQEGQSGTIDGVNYGGTGIDTLQDYLESAYKFGIAIVAILAVVMIGVGGFMYIVTSAGNASKLANAKEIITSAILGLVMALLSWLILFVINPDLVGDTLEGISLDTTNNSWVSDGKDDEACRSVNQGECEQTNRCSGGKLCQGKQCVYADRTLSDDCYKKVYGKKGIASPNQECGATGGTDTGLSGECTSSGVTVCPGSLITVINGKKCGDESICCSEGL